MSFELAWPQRSHRVRFKKAIRVVPLVEGPPRAYRVLSGNLSKQGMFLSTPEPFSEGTKVALSIEAGGRVLPFAQAEVMWRSLADGFSEQLGRPCGGAGFGVRFTNFLNPRAPELVEYLVDNLDTGRPLALPKRKRWARVAAWVGGIAASAMLAWFGTLLARNVTFESPAPEPVVEAPAVAPSPAPVAAVAEPPAAPEVVAPERVPEPERPPAPSKKEQVPAAPVLATAAPVAAAQPDPALMATGLLPLPKCAASSLRWAQRGSKTEIEVAASSGGAVAATFRMKHPERVVVDLSGTSPKHSFVVKAAEIPNVSALRIGKRKGGGTRLVLDLVKPAALKVDGPRLTLTY